MKQGFDAIYTDVQKNPNNIVAPYVNDMKDVHALEPSSVCLTTQ